MSNASEAAERIRFSLTAGKREMGKGQLIQVNPGDVVAVCDAIPEPTQVVQDLRRGSACLPPDMEPLHRPRIQVDCAFKLLDQFDKVQTSAP